MVSFGNRMREGRSSILKRDEGTEGIEKVMQSRGLIMGR